MRTGPTLATALLSLLSLLLSQRSFGSVRSVELKPDAMKSAPLTVSVSQSPRGAGQFEVAISGPVERNVRTIKPVLIIGTDENPRLESVLSTTEEVEQGKQYWRCTFRIDGELASDAVVTVRHDTGPVAVDYRIRVKDFLPAKKAG